MSKNGYYGYFSSYTEEVEEKESYDEQCQQQDALSYMTNCIDELVASFGYKLVNNYLQTFQLKNNR